MENDKIKEAIDFAAKLENASQFNVFWERPRREGFGVQLNFSGYNDLMLTVRDIMKVCVAALTEEDTASNLTISSVLEIALQLMPMEESMILDECHALHQKLKQTQPK